MLVYQLPCGLSGGSMLGEILLVSVPAMANPGPATCLERSRVCCICSIRSRLLYVELLPGVECCPLCMDPILELRILS